MYPCRYVRVHVLNLVRPQYKASVLLVLTISTGTRTSINLDLHTKFSTLEVEKFRRVVEYMRTTKIDPAQKDIARRDFHRWFTEHDKRRDCNLVETFPELEKFYNDYKA